MYLGLRVAVVVPAFNEESNLAATLATIPAFVDDVLVVDDGSTDASALIVQALQRPGLQVLRHTQNRGVGASVATGYRRALELNSDVALVMAGDGQMDPADLPALLAPIVAGQADYVKGNRFAVREVWRAMPKSRLLGNILLSLLTQLTSGYRHLFDSQCGYTAATRGVLRALDLDGLFPRYGYPNDLLARLFVVGARVVDVPVKPIYGPRWRSGISLRTAVYPVLFVVLRSLWWRKKMLRQIGRSAPRPASIVRPQFAPTGAAAEVSPPDLLTSVESLPSLPADASDHPRLPL